MADNTYTVPELDTIGSINSLQDLLIIEDVSLNKTFKVTPFQLLQPFRLNYSNESVGIGYSPAVDYKFGVFGNAEIQGNIVTSNATVEALTANQSVNFQSYGSGSNLDNSASYLLGADASGNIVEIEVSSVNAADNLGNHTATESLNMSNQSIINVTDIIGQAESFVSIKDSSGTNLARMNSAGITLFKNVTAEDSLNLTSYGAGNNIDNTSPYLLAVTSTGTVKEYEFSNLSPIQLITSADLSGEAGLYEDYVIGFGDGQFLAGRSDQLRNDYSIDLPNGDNVYSKTYVNINENSSLDNFYTENKCDYYQVMNTNYWQTQGVLNGVSNINKINTFSVHKTGTVIIGPDHDISPADRSGTNDFVKTSLFIGNSAVAPYSSSNTHLIIADGKISDRGDKMVSITNKGGVVIGSVPSGIVSQKETSFTLELKDNYSCIVDVTVIAKVNSIGDSSLAIGDVATVKSSYILNNLGGTLSSEQIGSDVSTSLGATTLSLGTSISNNPSKKSFTIFLNATNLGTNGSAKVSAQLNYTWLK